MPSPFTSSAILTGRSRGHLCGDGDAERLGAPVHRAVVEPFLALRDAARAAGLDLAIHSGFRSFERQLTIWNEKAAGTRPVLDSEARPLNVARLTERDLVFAILRWSALPGASRHHWGTDLDVYDAAATPAGYEIALVPEEVSPGGIFGPLHEWLDARITAGESHGFFRPYDADRGGVAPERWHLSYTPVASEYARRLTMDVLRETIAGAAIALQDAVLTDLEAIIERFVTNINPAFA